MRSKLNFPMLVEYVSYYCGSFVINTILKLIVERGHAVYTWPEMGIFTAVITLMYLIFFNSMWGILRNRW